MHQKHSFSWSQGVIPIENYSLFLTFYFEFLPAAIIQVPRFSGQTRSLFADKFPCGKGTDGHCDPKRKQLSFWISPFVLDACLQFSYLILVLYLGLSDFQEEDGWMQLKLLASSSEAVLWKQCCISYSVHDPTENLFQTTRRMIYLRFSGQMVPMGAALCQVPPVCQRPVLPSSCQLFLSQHRVFFSTKTISNIDSSSWEWREE